MVSACSLMFWVIDPTCGHCPLIAGINRQPVMRWVNVPILGMIQSVGGELLQKFVLRVRGCFSCRPHSRKLHGPWIPLKKNSLVRPCFIFVSSITKPINDNLFHTKPRNSSVLPLLDDKFDPAAKIPD